MAHTNQSSAISAQDDVINHISSSGITPPVGIEFDGNIHRFGSKKSSWYVAHLYPVTVCVYGDWKLGITRKYIHLDSHSLTPSAQAQVRQKLKAIALQRLADQEQQYQTARLKAQKFWDEAEPALFHEYLRCKQVLPMGIRVNQQGNLVIPLIDGEDIQSLQFIHVDGTKRFLKGGKVKGLYYPIQLVDQPEKLLICEGFATGATLYMETKLPVIVAFNSGNLLPVAEQIRQRYQEAEILICGDNDHSTKGNPGKKAAINAASACGGSWSVPDFTGLNPTSVDTDFNDLYLLQKASK